MPKILKLLTSSKAVKHYEILDYKQGSNYYFIKIRADLINQTILYIMEYVSEEEYNYSYHWQEENSELIIRWDNAPHHQQIKTFPHHKHIGEDILPSFEISLSKVLRYIEELLAI